jgi:ribulose-phosphate 3-epimerase
MEPKIRELKALIERRGLSDQVNIEVDGGIGPATIEGAAAAGANVLIAGTALFRYTEGLEFAVNDLRAKATAARAAQ